MKSIKKYLLIWFGQFFSVFGTTMTGFALGVWLYGKDGSVTDYSLILFAVVSPTILLAPLLGVIVDRWNRKKCMLLGHALAGVCTIAIITLYSIDVMELWLIIILVALSSIFNALVNSSFRASTPMLVEKDNLTRANGLNGVGRSLVTIFAPSLATLMLKTMGLAGVLAFDVVTFTVAIFCLFFVVIPQPEKSAVNIKDGIFSEIAFGFRYIKERKPLFNLLLFFICITFGLGLINGVFPPYVIDSIGEDGLAIVFAFGGLGMLVGGVLLAIIKSPKRVIYGIFACALIFGLTLFVAALSPTTILLSSALFIASASQIIAAGLNQALWQKKIELDIQGKVLSFATTIPMLALPVAYLSAGVLADKVFEPIASSELISNNQLLNSIGFAGNGRSLMLVATGVFIVLVTMFAFVNKNIRDIDTKISDKV